MSCQGESCSCGKGNHSSQHQKQALVQMVTSHGIIQSQNLVRGLESLSVDEEVVEVRFKNNRRIICRNISGLKLQKDDRVVVETAGGYDLGTVSLTGEQAQKQFDKMNNQTKKSSLDQIYRLATQEDLKQWLEAKRRERNLLLSSHDLAVEFDGDIRINDVEIEGDGKKVILYYTADQEKNLSHLIYKLETAFGIKVEMKQILPLPASTPD